MKCTICKKKINKVYSVISTCKCKNVFCSKHMHDHSCTFDYKEEFRVIQETKMEKVVAEKITKI